MSKTKINIYPSEGIEEGFDEGFESSKLYEIFVAN